MAKKRISLGGKKFFSIVVLSTLVLGLMVTTFSLQKPTNTQSEAACLTAPSLIYTAKNSYTDRNEFYFTLKNNCPGYNSFTLRVPQEPTSPYRLNAEWVWLEKSIGSFVCSKYNRAADGNNCYVAGVKGSRQLKFIVYEPKSLSAPVGTVFRSFVVKAALRSNSNLADYAKFNYKVK